jgi:D-aspartate ligase
VSEPSHLCWDQGPTPLSKNATVPVLLLKIGRYVVHHGSVGVIRSLGRLGVPVYGVVEDRFIPAAMSRYLTGKFVWDTRGLDNQRLLEGMAVIAGQLNRPAILLPTDDVGAIFVAEQADALRPCFLFPEQPAELPRIVANKRELHHLCEKLGVPHPQAVFPNSIDEVYQFLDRARFPIVVKMAQSWVGSMGVPPTSIVQTPKQLIELYQRVQTGHVSNLMLQEYIPPECAEDWIFHGYCNSKSERLVGFTGRKLRSYPPFAGPTTLGQSIENEALRQQTWAFLRAISYSGIMDLDYRFDRRDHQYKLLDFNPRIGAQFRLFQDDAGIDVARALYLDLTQGRVANGRPVEGRTFIAEPFDMVAGVFYTLAGQQSVAQWWRSFSGRKEFAWFSRDDVVPFLMMFLRLLQKTAQKILVIRQSRRGAYRAPRYVKGRGRRADGARPPAVAS